MPSEIFKQLKIVGDHEESVKEWTPENWNFKNIQTVAGNLIFVITSPTIFAKNQNKQLYSILANPIETKSAVILESLELTDD